MGGAACSSSSQQAGRTRYSSVFINSGAVLAGAAAAAMGLLARLQITTIMSPTGCPTLMAMVHQAILAIMVVALAIGSSEASSPGPGADPRCSLLGAWVTSSSSRAAAAAAAGGGGHCECDSGWTGTTCSVANLKPLDPALGYHNESAASWGGRAVRDPSRPELWHLFASQFSNCCPLVMWTNNSQVVRATSKSGPAGPYTFAEEVYSEFHHNPSVIGPTPDGYYLIFMIGSHQPHVADCSRGVDPEWGGSGDWLMSGHIAMGYARSPT
jgi:hypothetical protein